MKTKSLLKYSAVVLIIALGVGGVSLITYSPRPAAPGSDLFEVKKNLDIFHDVYGKVEVMYVDEPNPGQLMKTGIDAMLKSLDPYTNYIPESKIEDYRFMTTGAYGGVGALISTINDKVIITEPYEGYPIVDAGLMAGDEIIEVDGKSVVGKKQAEISELLKGQPESTVELAVKRAGVDGVIRAKVTRKKIQLPDVPYYGMVDAKTGYVKLNSFTMKAASDVMNAYRGLENEGMEQFVLDLRGNGGGLLMEAVKIVNMFVPKGTKVVEMRGRIDNTNKTYMTEGKPLNTEIPIAVLVDENSASASEIVSGALQDLDRAIIVGTRTFGKGLVQQTHDLKYNGKIKITIAKYYIPSGRCIQKVDYFNKENGKAKSVPDSLINEFKTSNGRIVHDGSGVLPDVEIDLEPASNLAVALLTNRIIFDFATSYRLKKDSIKDAVKFNLSETDFKEFKNAVRNQEFTYTNESLKQLEKLRKQAEMEKYMKDVEAQLQALEKTFTPDKNDDLERYKEEVTTMLENEIVSRYYYQTGRIKHALRDDIFLAKAIKVLNDRSEYNRILGNP